MNAGGVHVGIDAVNIRQGGGVTHLTQLLQAAEPAASGVARVTVWTGPGVAALLPDLPWLAKRTPDGGEGSAWSRLLRRQLQVPREARAAGCDVLFYPGGTLPMYSPLPAVTMSQNMLPFDAGEARLFGRWRWMRLKMWLLRHTQGHSFLRAAGVIFLTEYARREITRALGRAPQRTALIPHGIEPRFFTPPRAVRALSECSVSAPLRLLYVSIVMPYKRQCEVAQAIAKLRAQGLRLELTFVGGSWRYYGARFERLRLKLDPSQMFLKWPGAEPFEAVHQRYRTADIFVFASGCENLPNILIEAMAAGLPVASADRGPMPEVLGDAGVYFDPDRPAAIADTLRGLAEDTALRQTLAARAWEKAQAYSWQRCARDTFDFIGGVVSHRD